METDICIRIRSTLSVLVVDWLDACTTLLGLYDASRSLRCACSGRSSRDNLFRCWSVRLERSVPDAFTLMDLEMIDQPSLRMSYIGYDDRPVKARFSFTKAGRIADMRCNSAPMYSTPTSVKLSAP
jgi:hypothetical protein